MSRSRASTEAGRRRTTAGRSSAAGRKAAPRRAASRAKAEVPAAKRAAGSRPRSRSAPHRKPAAVRRPARRRPRRTRSTGRRWPLSRPRPLRAARAGLGRASWRYRLALVAILGATLAAGYFFWLRDSSLVAVDDVEVVGVTSGDREQIVTELTQMSEGMTTLHADTAKLEQAARAYPTVAAVDVDPNFPHGMRIEITERPPALLVTSGGEEVPVAADGTLLGDVPVSEDDHLPVLEVGEVPPSGSLEGGALEQALVLGAVPEPLRPLIEKIDTDDDFGIVVALRGGIPVRFGTGADAGAKWSAAAAVLADPKLDGLTYVDVRVPDRPAAGGAAPAVATHRPSSVG